MFKYVHDANVCTYLYVNIHIHIQNEYIYLYICTYWLHTQLHAFTCEWFVVIYCLHRQ